MFFDPGRMEANENRDLEMLGGLLLPKVPFDLTLALRWDILEVIIGGFFLVLTVENEEIGPAN